jgi:alkane 1-monooxygenase
MLKYLRFMSIYPLVAVTGVGLALGGPWMWLGFVTVYLMFVVGDGLLGDDLSEPVYAHTGVLNATLYCALPMIVLITLPLAWMLGTDDLLGLGAWVQATFGYDMFAARTDTTALNLLGGVLSLGLSYAAIGTNIGHELTHRTQDPVAMFIGRWLLAFTLDAEFSIEHVYGHHNRLGTARDPATARRGEHFYAFLVRSLIGQTRSAWALESARLTRLGHAPLGWRNRMLRGWLMSLVIVAAFYTAGGLTAALVWLATALAGRTVLEAVNYFEHYGLVRVEGEPIEPRHSWNTNKRLTNVALFNLARHSHHHAEGDAQFWKLRPYPEAPTLPFGYLTSMLLVYVVPGWYRRMMTPLLLEWDRRHASPAERKLAEQANRDSGIAELTLAAQS